MAAVAAPVFSAGLVALIPVPAAFVAVPVGAPLPVGLLVAARAHQRVVDAHAAATPADKTAIAQYVVNIENRNLHDVVQTTVAGSIAHYAAKSANALVVGESELLTPVPSMGGALPAAFPQDRYALFHLTGPAMTPLENFYGLAHAGNVRQRQEALAIAFGIRV